MSVCLLSTADAAREAKVTPQYLHKLWRRGLIAPPVKIWQPAAASKYPVRSYRWPRAVVAVARKAKAAGGRKERRANPHGHNQHGSGKEPQSKPGRVRCRHFLMSGNEVRLCVMGVEACAKCGYRGMG